MPKVAASILSADMSRLLEQVRMVEPHVDALHIDLMDAHFVPTLGVQPEAVAALRPHTRLFFHCHLMLTDPAAQFDVLEAAGADQITCHVEAVGEPAAVLDDLAGRGIRAGLALNPDTPADAAFPFLDDLAVVNVMSVHPGWAGQAFLPEVLPKVAVLRDEIDRRGLPTEIEMDGGINAETGARCLEAGATVLAAASSIFKADDPLAAVRRLAALVGRAETSAGGEHVAGDQG